MREFFKGWRQRIGLTTLLVACLFTVAWVRSVSMVDFIVLNPWKSAHWLLVSGGQHWRIVRGWSIVLLKQKKQIDNRTIRSVNLIENSDPWSGNAFDWYSENASEFALLRNPFDEGSVLPMIPYWSIVLPLTMLSAWLLLSKPRPVKPSTQPPESH